MNSNWSLTYKYVDLDGRGPVLMMFVEDETNVLKLYSRSNWDVVLDKGEELTSSEKEQ